MAVSIEALGIDRLSIRERLELIEQIWDSLPENVSPDEVAEWHLIELAERRPEVDASPGLVVRPSPFDGWLVSDASPKRGAETLRRSVANPSSEV
jgi:putative addiction module component (TIGR02574 family)